MKNNDEREIKKRKGAKPRRWRESEKNTFIFIFGLKNDPPKKGYDPSKKLAKKRRRRIE